MSWFEHAGSNIYYEQEGMGDPLLFLPGFTESIDEFGAVRDALSAQFTVFAADLPGSGKSGPQPREYNPTYYQDDATLFLAFTEHVGLSPAHVAGFSDGGEVALLMAEDRPDAVRSLVAWGTAGSVVVPDDLIAAFYDLIDNPGEGFEEFSERMKLQYGKDNARKTIQSAARAWQAIIEAGGDISRSRAGQIAAPVLLISGEHDLFAPLAVVSELAGAIPQGESIEVKNAGHSLHETHKEWLIDTMRSWLANH